MHDTAISLGDIAACLLGFVFPYFLFLTYRPPFNLRLDASKAGKLEKLSYSWLKPLLALSGIFIAGAAYADRHSNDGFTFGLLLGAGFAVWLLTAPAGSIAFRQAYGWDRRRQRRKR